MAMSLQNTNVYNYLVGQTRFYLHKIRPRLVRLHIREQVGYRRSACSPQCKYEARCCGCIAPNVFFAPKGCGNGNYPKLMSKRDWRDYKSKYNNRISYLQDTIFGYTGSMNIYFINQLTEKELIDMKAKVKSIGSGIIFEPVTIEVDDDNLKAQEPYTMFASDSFMKEPPKLFKDVEQS